MVIYDLSKISHNLSDSVISHLKYVKSLKCENINVINDICEVNGSSEYKIHNKLDRIIIIDNITVEGGIIKGDLKYNSKILNKYSIFFRPSFETVLIDSELLPTKFNSFHVYLDKYKLRENRFVRLLSKLNI